MRYFSKILLPFGLASLCLAIAHPAAAQVSHDHLMYIGTLDKKLLVMDEQKDEVVGEIPLEGVPRATALSADQKQLYIINTKMTIEVVDLAARKEISSFSLSDGRSKPRMAAGTVARGVLSGRFSGLAVDPNGRYLYATMKSVVKDIDEYRIGAPKFVVIDLQDKTIAKTFDFPAEFDQGFGFMATYKVSPDGKLLYVFDDDILIFDLATFKEVGRIPLAQPPYPGASPYRLTVSEDPYDDPSKVTNVFTSVDPIVHKGTLGLATINLLTRDVKYEPIGPSLPMLGFMLSPDRRLGYSVMFTSAGGNRQCEWWVWDIARHQVIKKAEFESRPTFKFGESSDGKQLFLYGAGSTFESFDAETLKSRKLVYLNKDTTTNLITIAEHPALLSAR
ncbi:MAG TPA: hypothetical protein VHZ07_18745 [Bryobacteraceae bacterium]|jgi:hypothetical protein|nr:hypothetical protein [Bryobacteraceae bacterium]